MHSPKLNLTVSFLALVLFSFGCSQAKTSPQDRRAVSGGPDAASAPGEAATYPVDIEPSDYDLASNALSPVRAAFWKQNNEDPEICLLRKNRDLDCYPAKAAFESSGKVFGLAGRSLHLENVDVPIFNYDWSTRSYDWYVKRVGDDDIFPAKGASKIKVGTMKINLDAGEIIKSFDASATPTYLLTSLGRVFWLDGFVAREISNFMRPNGDRYTPQSNKFSRLASGARTYTNLPLADRGGVLQDGTAVHFNHTLNRATQLAIGDQTVKALKDIYFDEFSDYQTEGQRFDVGVITKEACGDSCKANSAQRVMITTASPKLIDYFNNNFSCLNNWNARWADRTPAFDFFEKSDMRFISGKCVASESQVFCGTWQPLWRDSCDFLPYREFNMDLATGEEIVQLSTIKVYGQKDLNGDVAIVRTSAGRVFSLFFRISEDYKKFPRWKVVEIR